VADGSGTAGAGPMVTAVDAAECLGADPPAVPAMVTPPIVAATTTPTIATVVRVLLIFCPSVQLISWQAAAAECAVAGPESFCQ